MMIEADVLFGTIKGDKDGVVLPVMAHPPAKTSDLSLEEFLDTILDNDVSKGIKLDFKEIGVVESALILLKERENRVKLLRDPAMFGRIFH